MTLSNGISLAFQNSKQGILMVLFGMLGLFFDVASLIPITGTFAAVLKAVEGFIVFMGVRDIMLANKQSILAAVADWRSKTFWGSFISFLMPLFLNPESVPGIPDETYFILKMVGIVLTVFGWAAAGARGHFAVK